MRPPDILIQGAVAPLKPKERRFMFGQYYVLIETVDGRGKRVEQWVAEAANVETNQFTIYNDKLCIPSLSISKWTLMKNGR